MSYCKCKPGSLGADFDPLDVGGNIDASIADAQGGQVSAGFITGATKGAGGSSSGGGVLSMLTNPFVLTAAFLIFMVIKD